MHGMLEEVMYPRVHSTNYWLRAGAGGCQHAYYNYKIMFEPIVVVPINCIFSEIPYIFLDLIIDPAKSDHHLPTSRPIHVK